MTRHVPPAFWILTLAATVFSMFNALAVRAAEPCGPGVEAVRVDGEVLCTHGNDEPPPGVDTTELPSTEELLEARFGVDTVSEVAAEISPEDEPYTAPLNSVACVGDGITGPRIQLVYARAGDVAGRYDSVVPLIRQYAADADDIINVSAGRVGDGRRVRFVTNDSCVPQVLNLKLSNSGDDTFGNMVTELRNHGLTDIDRKYLVFMDAAVGICGLGEVYLNDSREQTNPNNSGRPMYARVDTSCWQHAAAHELLHTMGAVQNSAPNSSGYGHCTDEVDVMCYRDSSTTVTRQVCDRAGQVDCNNNDYFHPNPATNSYLDNKWNVARSRYLAGADAVRPPVTTVTVPSSGLAGVPWGVRADLATEGASVVWSSTRSGCWFANPRAAATTWTCPATAAPGAAEININVTENGVTTPYNRPVQIMVPETKMKMSTSMRLRSRITVGGSTRIRGKFLSTGTAAPVAGLPTKLQARPAGVNRWVSVATDTTGPKGVAIFPVSPKRNTSYRVRSALNPTWETTFISRQGLAVSAKLTAKVNSRNVYGMTTTSVRERNNIRIAGRVSPSKAGKIIRLKRYRDGRWRTIREKRLNSNSGFVFYYRPTTSGTHRLSVVKPDDFRNAGKKRTIRLSVG